MQFTKTLILFWLITVTGLVVSISPNTANAFPFPPGNPNSGSSACYHNGEFNGMVYGGASCPTVGINDISHIPVDEDGKALSTFKHTPEDCVITETPFND